MPTVYRSVEEAREDSFQLPVPVSAAGAVSENSLYLTAPKLISSEAPASQKGKIRPSPVLLSSSSLRITLSGTAVANYSTNVDTYILKVTTSFLNPGETEENELILRYRHWDYKHYWVGDTEYYDEIILVFKLKLKTISYKCTTAPDFQLVTTSETKNFDYPNYTAKLGEVTFSNASILHSIYPSLVRKYNINSLIFSPTLWPYFTHDPSSINLTYRYIPKGYPMPLIHRTMYAQEAFAELRAGIAELKLTFAVSGCLGSKTLSGDVTLQVGQPVQEIINYPKTLSVLYPPNPPYYVGSYSLVETTSRGTDAGKSCPLYVRLSDNRAIYGTGEGYLYYPGGHWPYKQIALWDSARSGVVAVDVEPAEIADNQVFNFYQGEYSEGYIKIKKPETFGNVWAFVNPPAALGGLTLAKDGKISGIPTGVGNFTVSVNILNSKGSTTKNITIAIIAGIPKIANPPVLTPAVLQPFSYKPTLMYGNATSWSLHGPNPLPQGLTLNTSTGEVAGVPSVLNLTNSSELTATTETWDFVKYSDADFNAKNFYSNFSQTNKATLHYNTPFFRSGDKALELLAGSIAFPRGGGTDINRTYAFWVDTVYTDCLLLHRPGDGAGLPTLKLVELKNRQLIFRLSCYDRTTGVNLGNDTQFVNTNLILPQGWNFIAYTVHASQKSVSCYLNGIKVGEIKAAIFGVSNSNVALTNLSTYANTNDTIFACTTACSSPYSGRIAYYALDSTTWSDAQVFHAYYKTNPFVPSQVGTKYFTALKAISARGSSESALLAFEIQPSPPKITLNQSIIAGHGVAVKRQITLDDSVNRPATSWSASGLPTGLTLNSTTGEIAGSTNCSRNSTDQFFVTTNYDVTVTASNSAGSHSVIVKVIVHPVPVVASGQVFSFALGANVNTALILSPSKADNPLQPSVTSWSTSAPGYTQGNQRYISALGLWLNLTTGVLSGVASRSTSNYQFQVTAKSLQDVSPVAGMYAPHLVSTPATITVNVAYGAPKIIVPGRGADFKISTAVSYTIVADDVTNRPVSSWAAAGLPAGLSISASTGVISGIPTTIGTYTSTVTATGSGGSSSATFTFRVLNNLTDNGTMALVYGEPMPKIKVIGDLTNITAWQTNNKPDWMTFTQSTAELEGTVGANLGTFTVTFTPTYTVYQQATIKGIGHGCHEMAIAYNDTTVYLDPAPTNYEITLPWKAPAGEKVTGVAGSKHVLGISTDKKTYWFASTPVPSEFSTAAKFIGSTSTGSTFHTNMREGWTGNGSYYDYRWIRINGTFYGFDIFKNMRSGQANSLYSSLQRTIMYSAAYIGPGLALRLYMTNDVWNYDYAGAINTAMANDFYNRATSLQALYDNYKRANKTCSYTWRASWTTSELSSFDGVYLPPDDYGWIFGDGKFENVLVSGQDKAFSQQHMYALELPIDQSYSGIRYNVIAGKIARVIFASKEYNNYYIAYINTLGDLECNLSGTKYLGLSQPRSACTGGTANDSVYNKTRISVKNKQAEYANGAIIYLGTDDKAYSYTGTSAAKFFDDVTTFGNPVDITFEVLMGKPKIKPAQSLVLVLNEQMSWTPELEEPYYRTPSSWTVSNLPEGLQFNTTTGQITGVISSHFNGTITVTAVNSAGASSVGVNVSTRERVKLLADDQILSGKVGELWNSSPVKISIAGWENLTWKIKPSSSVNEGLPEGLTFDSATGVIAGEPTKAYPGLSTNGVQTYQYIEISASRQSDGLESYPQLVKFDIAYGRPELAPLPKQVIWQRFSFYVSSVAYGNNMFVSQNYYSLDGINWKWTTSSFASDHFTNSRTVYVNNKFVVIGRGLVAQSSDGINWTFSATSTNLTWHLGFQFAYGNSRALMINNSGGYAYSSDFINWTVGTITLPAGYGTGKLIFSNTTNKFYLIAGKESAGGPVDIEHRLYTSSDGVVWGYLDFAQFRNVAAVRDVTVFKNFIYVSTVDQWPKVSKLWRLPTNATSGQLWELVRTGTSQSLLVSNETDILIWGGEYLPGEATENISDWLTAWEITDKISITFSNGKFFMYAGSVYSTTTTYSDTRRVFHLSAFAGKISFILNNNETVNFANLNVINPTEKPVTSYTIKNKKTGLQVANSFDLALFSQDFASQLITSSQGTSRITSISLFGDLKHPLTVNTDGSRVDILSITLTGPGGTTTTDIYVVIAKGGTLAPPIPKNSYYTLKQRCPTPYVSSSVKPNHDSIWFALYFGEFQHSTVSDARLEQWRREQLVAVADQLKYECVGCYPTGAPPCIITIEAVVGEQFYLILESMWWHVDVRHPSLNNYSPNAESMVMGVVSSGEPKGIPLKITGGALPPGVALDNWWLTGIPTTEGDYGIYLDFDLARYEWMVANFNNTPGLTIPPYLNAKFPNSNQAGLNVVWTSASSDKLSIPHLDRREVTLKIVDFPRLKPAQSFNVTLGQNTVLNLALQDETQRVKITGWSAVGLPQGLAINSSGNITGITHDPTLVTSGTSVQVSIASTAGGKARTTEGSLTLNFKFQAPQISDRVIAGIQHSNFYQSLGQSPSYAPIYEWVITEGALPAGLSLVSGVGEIKGIPTGYGSFTLKIKASGPGGDSNTAVITIGITKTLKKITPGQRITLTTETPFSYEIQAAGGNSTDYLTVSPNTPSLGTNAPQNSAGIPLTVSDLVASWYEQATNNLKGVANFVTPLTGATFLPDVHISNNSSTSGIPKWSPLVFERRWVSVNRPGNLATFSSDGKTWSKTTLPYKIDWRFVRALNGKIFAFAGGTVAVSSNGGSLWTTYTREQTGLPDLFWVGLLFNVPGYIVNGYVLFASDASVWTSSNGVAWTQSGQVWSAQVYINGKKFAACDYSPPPSTGTISKIYQAGSLTVNNVLAVCSFHNLIVILAKQAPSSSFINPKPEITFLCTFNLESSTDGGYRWHQGPKSAMYQGQDLEYYPANVSAMASGFTARPYTVTSVALGQTNIIAAGKPMLVLIGGSQSYVIFERYHLLGFECGPTSTFLSFYALPSQGNWTQLAYGNYKFVAIKAGGVTADNNGGAVLTDNGWVNFSVPPPLPGYSWSSLSFYNGKFSLISQPTTSFAAIPETVDNKASVIFSDDGVNWFFDFYMLLAYKDNTSVGAYEKVYLTVNPLPPLLPANTTIYLEEYATYDDYLITFQNTANRPIDRWEVTGLPTWGQNRLVYSPNFPGKISGVAPAAGTYENIAIKVFNVSGEATGLLTLKVVVPSPRITPGQTFKVFSGDLQATTNSSTPTAGGFSILPTLVKNYPGKTLVWKNSSRSPTEVFPPTIAMNTATGEITGRLTKLGDYKLRLGVSIDGPEQTELVTISVLPGIPKIKAAQKFTQQIGSAGSMTVQLEDSVNAPANAWRIVSGSSIYTINNSGVLSFSSTPSAEISETLSIAVKNTTHMSSFGYSPETIETVTISWFTAVPSVQENQRIYGEVGVAQIVSPLQLVNGDVVLSPLSAVNGLPPSDLYLKPGDKALFLSTSSPYLNNSYRNGAYVLGTADFVEANTSIGLTVGLRYLEPSKFPSLQKFGAITGTPTKKLDFTAVIDAGTGSAQTSIPVRITIRGGVPIIKPNQKLIGYVGEELDRFVELVDSANRPAITAFVPKSGTALPANLNIDSVGAAGIRIKGIPSAEETKTVTVQVIGEANTSSVENITIQTYASLPRIKPAAFYYTELGKAINIALEADPAFAPACIWQLRTLTNGLSLNSDKLVGAISTLGTHDFQVRAGTCKGTYGPIGLVTVHVDYATPDIVKNQTFTGAERVVFRKIVAFNPPLGYLGEYQLSATGLPKGLSLTGTGILEGVPTESGDFAPTLTLSNAKGSSTVNIGLKITPATVAFTFRLLTFWINEAVNLKLAVSQGSASGWKAVPLPAGLKLDEVTGELTGTPTVLGNTSSYVTVTGTDFSKFEAVVVITIASRMKLKTGQTIKGLLGISLSYQVTFEKSTAATIDNWSATGLPNGLTISTSGVISGMPLSTGTYTATITATAGVTSVSENIVVSIVVGSPKVTESQVFTGKVGEALTANIQADEQDDRPVSAWSITGLPLGLEASANVVTGTPVKRGIFSASAAATNFAGTTKQPVTFNIAPGKPIVKENQILGFSTLIATNVEKIELITPFDRPASSWTVNNLPAGVTLNAATGELSGAAASGKYTLQATAEGEGGISDSRDVTLISTAYKIKVFKDTINSVAVLGEITGVVFYEIKQGTLPAGLVLDRYTGKISGVLSSNDESFIVLEITKDDGSLELLDVYISIADAPPKISPQSRTYKRLAAVNDNTLSFSGSSIKFSLDTLPEGLNFDENTGRIHGTPQKVEVVTATLKAENSGGSAEAQIIFEIAADFLAPSLTQFLVPFITKRNHYMQEVSVQNTAGPIENWEVSTLPAGLYFEAFSQTLKGRPTVKGDFSISFKASNAIGSSTTVLNLQIISEITKPVVAPNQVYSIFEGSAISEKIIISEGSADRFNLLDTLPASLTFNSSTGEITGTIDSLGESVVALTAVNAEHISDVETIKIIGIAKKITTAPVVTAGQIANFYLGESSSYNLLSDMAIDSSLLWTLLAGYSLPAGLVLRARFGDILGIPTALGSTTVKVIAKNSVGESTPAEVVINVLPSSLAPSIQANQQIQAIQNQNIRYTLISTNSPTSWGIVTGSLPENLSLAASTGEIYGTVASAATYVIKIYATNSYGRAEQDITIEVSSEAPEVVDNQLIEIATYVNFTQAVKYFKGVPTSWSVAGILPTGITFDTSKGEFSGVATQVFNGSVIVTATNTGGSSSKSVAILITEVERLALVTNQRFYGKVGQAFSAQLKYTGKAPEKWATSSTLPAGLILNSTTGTITGTPTTLGASSLNITISHSSLAANTENVTIEILSRTANLKIVTGQLFTFAAGDAFSFTPAVIGTVVSWKAGGLPSGVFIDAQTGQITGTLTAGQYTFTLICKDNTLTATGTIKLKIT